ncbi:hypothetical protein BZG36_04412 [Bifiguratus adelaidae]|uniref:Uncharacterized protein n=1 Tax=Bifiguratus adelaidae TaxID=1938954 RepID=A0A261XW94_9FUNG|nr:hypothetical protein BZG36_04412 [Bifiguratus adelaidae]
MVADMSDDDDFGGSVKDVPRNTRVPPTILRARNRIEERLTTQEKPSALEQWLIANRSAKQAAYKDENMQEAKSKSGIQGYQSLSDDVNHFMNVPSPTKRSKARKSLLNSSPLRPKTNTIVLDDSSPPAHHADKSPIRVHRKALNKGRSLQICSESSSDEEPVIRRAPAKKQRLVKRRDIPFASDSDDTTQSVKKAVKVFDLDRHAKSSDDERVAIAADNEESSPDTANDSLFSRKNDSTLPSLSRTVTIVSSEDETNVKDLSFGETSKETTTVERNIIDVDDIDLEENKSKRTRQKDSLKEEQDQEMLRYFNERSDKDIARMLDCTPKQAAKIVKMRPFLDLADFQSKVEAEGRMMQKLLQNYLVRQEAFQVVDQVISDIELLGEELIDNVTSWRQSTEIGSERILKQPTYLAEGMRLKDYQINGVAWLRTLYQRQVSGILADEMGLGKTAQVITFLGSVSGFQRNGPHLVIVPSSTLQNWVREFEKFVPSLVVKTYHGSVVERLYIREELSGDRAYDVLLTTYNIATSSKDDRKFLKNLKCASMILDEGHFVKNCATARYEQLTKVKTPFRLLLTGTPLQNNLQELVSLLMFILPDLFREHEEMIRKVFSIKVDTSSNSSDFTQLLSKRHTSRAKKLLDPFILRRRKADVLKDMPAKIISFEQCDMTPAQSDLYKDIFQTSRQSYKALSAGKGNEVKSNNGAKKPQGLSNILMQLRKAADHPMLFRRLFDDNTIRKMAKDIMKEERYWDAEETYIYEDMSVMTDFELHNLCLEHKHIRPYALKDEPWMKCGKVLRLKAILEDRIPKGDRILLFSQFTMMLDILEKVMNSMNLTFLRLDGSSKVETRQALIDEYNEGDANIPVFLLSTKAAGLGINLTSANVVILYDIDFNPHNDKQAEDRAHRVGQTRDVHVIKLISKDTVENNIHRMADYKLKLDQSISGTESNIDIETDVADDDTMVNWYNARFTMSQITADKGSISEWQTKSPQCIVGSLTENHYGTVITPCKDALVIRSNPFYRLENNPHQILLIEHTQTGRTSTFEHPGGVTCHHSQAQSPFLVTGSLEGRVRLWHVPKGELVEEWAAHRGRVLCVALNEETIVSGGADCTICVMDHPEAKIPEMEALLADTIPTSKWRGTIDVASYVKATEEWLMGVSDIAMTDNLIACASDVPGPILVFSLLTGTLVYEIDERTAGIGRRTTTTRLSFMPFFLLTPGCVNEAANAGLHPYPIDSQRNIAGCSCINVWDMRNGNLAYQLVPLSETSSSQSTDPLSLIIKDFTLSPDFSRLFALITTRKGDVEWLDIWDFTVSQDSLTPGALPIKRMHPKVATGMVELSSQGSVWAYWG